jgi:hypothetical protein
VDERELRSLFTIAPGEPPPPTFDATDVRAASARATARRRTRLLAGGGVAVVVLFAAGLIGVLLARQVDHGPTAGVAGAPAQHQVSGSGQPGQAPMRPPDSGGTEGFPNQQPEQGGAGPGEDGPRTEGTPGCEKADGELATALAGELPVPGSPAGAGPGRLCTPGARSAGFSVDGGSLSVVVLPQGMANPFPQPAGAAAAAGRKTASGGLLLLVSDPHMPGAAPPLAGDLNRIATDLAARF